MIRWTPPPSPIAPQRWQSREEILKSHLDSLSSDELMRVRPDYWALRFGPAASASPFSKALHPSHYDPNQPRVPRGNPEGGQWTDGEGPSIGSDAQLASFDAAARRGKSAAFCMAQYAIDNLLCGSVEPASSRAVCRGQATERLAACLSGRQVPPLSY